MKKQFSRRKTTRKQKTILNEFGADKKKKGRRKGASQTTEKLLKTVEQQTT